MRDVLVDMRAFRARGERVGRAVLTSVVGSAPRPEGATMIVTDRGSMAGSVSGGCIEGAVFTEIQRSIESGRRALLTYGVSDEAAWDVGLACGGTFEVLVEPAIAVDVESAAASPRGSVVATVLAGPRGMAESVVIDDDGVRACTAEGGTAEGGTAEGGAAGGPLAGTAGGSREAIIAAGRAALAREASGTITIPTPGGDVTVFLEVFAPRPRLVVFGGVHVAVALVRLARELGYHTIVADGRATFANRERFPDADEVIVAWPDEAFARVGLDSSSYVAVLTHDPKFDEPALAIALRSPARYVGAIGSRRTQAARRGRLRAAGVEEEHLARLRGPIGLDLGGRGASEIALAIVAEMTAVRYGGDGRPMVESGTVPGSAVS